MSQKLFAERVAGMIPRYESIFAERGNVTPADPLEFHLYHLARYWNRLVGFCRQDPSNCAGFIDGDLGACIQVGAEFASGLITPNSPIYDPWQACWLQTQAVLYQRPVSLETVEAASRSFEACLAVLNYNPWK